LRKEQVENDFTNAIFLDETGINCGITRLYARAPKGERVVDYVPDVRFKRMSILSSIKPNGEFISFVYKGSLNGNLFREYITEKLAPKLKKGDVVYMDNLSVHKVKGIKEAIDSCGATLRFLPKYSPDFNPIEHIWSELKADLRGLKPRTDDEMRSALDYAFANISPEHIQNNYSNCGYKFEL
jgi:transposase